ncbi:MAG TPA: carboxypeptidase-like regulatory domain-containing protein, partial [Edaphobacter sp.]
MRLHRIFVLLILALVPTVLFTNNALAQTSFGQISGSITDSTGAFVPAVSVKITEQSTQVARTYTADSNGFYIATNLHIGTYTITVSHTGFNTAEQRDVAIVADAKITANFTLSIGTATESVQVTATGVETLNATSGEVSRTIDTKQVENLALNGRNYTQLMTLVPGAVVTNPDIFAVTTSLASTNQTINGNRSDSNNLTVDGAYNQVAG